MTNNNRNITFNKDTYTSSRCATVYFKDGTIYRNINLFPFDTDNGVLVAWDAMIPSRKCRVVGFRAPQKSQGFLLNRDVLKVQLA
ncbi:hypothetical protein [Bifidobacterium sp. SO1]|uniref:hypothetical protein n=1 Tax=Bifidobacterium sp. SO1 TaxID=2809029 RepID=UPI001BDC02CE|nr:hypothetical protein [Bifidobacterium sp. SO1]MBT1162218.1 hypothetical protein [Bifidobacterium sp. SO1]